MCFDLKRALYITNFVVIKQIGLPLRGRPILLITRLITDRIGLHSVLLPLLIILIIHSKYFFASDARFVSLADLV